MQLLLMNECFNIPQFVFGLSLGRPTCSFFIQDLPHSHAALYFADRKRLVRSNLEDRLTMLRQHSGTVKWILTLFLPILATRAEDCGCDPAALYEYENKIPDAYIVGFKNVTGLPNASPDGSGVRWEASSSAPQGNLGLANLTDEMLAKARTSCEVDFLETNALGEWAEDSPSNASTGGDLVRRAAQRYAQWCDTQVLA